MKTYIIESQDSGLEKVEVTQKGPLTKLITKFSKGNKNEIVYNSNGGVTFRQYRGGKLETELEIPFDVLMHLGPAIEIINHACDDTVFEGYRIYSQEPINTFSGKV